MGSTTIPTTTTTTTTTKPSMTYPILTKLLWKVSGEKQQQKQQHCHQWQQPQHNKNNNNNEWLTQCMTYYWHDFDQTLKLSFGDSIELITFHAELFSKNISTNESLRLTTSSKELTWNWQIFFCVSFSFCPSNFLVNTHQIYNYNSLAAKGALACRLQGRTAWMNWKYSQLNPAWAWAWAEHGKKQSEHWPTVMEQLMI